MCGEFGCACAQVDRDPRWPGLLLTCYPHISASCAAEGRARSSFKRCVNESLPPADNKSNNNNNNNINNDNDSNNNNNNNDANNNSNSTTGDTKSGQSLSHAAHWHSSSSSTVCSSGSSVDAGDDADGDEGEDDGYGDPTHMWRLVWDSGASVMVELLEPAAASSDAPPGSAADEQLAGGGRVGSGREQRWSSSDEAAAGRLDESGNVKSAACEGTRDERGVGGEVDAEALERSLQKEKEAAAAAFTYWPIEGSAHYGCLEVCALCLRCTHGMTRIETENSFIPS